MREKNTSEISRFGFRLEKVGVHTFCVSSPDSTKIDYLKAIKEDNCLGKRSGRSRKLAASHLFYLYSLDSSHAIFRSLHYFWNRDVERQPIGWDPDLNDGVLLNIRPFMSVPDVGRKSAGVQREKPNINWKKGRGKDVESASWYHRLGATG